MENLLLRSLSQRDRDSLNLKKIDATSTQVLYEPGDTIATVYFPGGSIVSLVVALTTGETIEAAMVGRDGIVGGAAAINGRISVCRAIVQLSGPAFSCDVDVLKSTAMKSEQLHSLLIRHEQTILDVDGMRETACECYDAVNRNYAQLLGSKD